MLFLEARHCDEKKLSQSFDCRLHGRCRFRIFNGFRCQQAAQCILLFVASFVCLQKGRECFVLRRQCSKINVKPFIALQWRQLPQNLLQMLCIFWRK